MIGTKTASADVREFTFRQSEIAYTHMGSQAYRGLVTKVNRDGVMLECIERVLDRKVEQVPGKLFARRGEVFPSLEGLNASPKFLEKVKEFGVFIDSLCGAGSTVKLPCLSKSE